MSLVGPVYVAGGFGADLAMQGCSVQDTLCRDCLDKLQRASNQPVRGMVSQFNLLKQCAPRTCLEEHPPICVSHLMEAGYFLCPL